MKKGTRTLPDFSTMTLQEIAKFWDTHDSADYWDQMGDVTDRVRLRRSPDRTVSVRIARDDLSQLKQIAYERGLGHTTLIRQWIKERLRASGATK